MSKKEEMRAKRRRQKRIETAITVGVVVVLAFVFLLFLVGPTIREVLFPTEMVPVVEWTTEPRPNPDQNAMGDPNAPLKIEEFSDFQCPYCGLFGQQTEPLIAENFVKTGKVYFVYRSMDNFISENIARATNRIEKTESRDAAVAAYCGADQGKFWEMRDGLFINNLGEDVNSYTQKRLLAIAELGGLNMGEFEACMKSGKYLDQVKQDAVDGRAAGVTATPSFVLTYTVDGETKQKLIVGAQPYEQFQQEIEAALAEMGL